MAASSLLLLFLCCSLGSVAADWDWNTTTPLDDYVWRDDGYYEWRYLTEYRYNNVTVYMVNMTSQKWFDESFCDHPVWWHLMGIAIPDNVKHPDGGLMYVGENSNRHDVPGALYAHNLAVALFAGDTGVVTGYLLNIPNQPIVFVDDPTQRPRKEDSQIAWTWSEFVRKYPDEPELLSRFPMTKATVKGMDAITEVARDITGQEIDKFVITGASKRGWTVWTTAAVDKRVKVAIPMVMGLLNMREDLMHHFRSLGGWSFAFESYYRENLTMEWDNPNFDLLATHVDPYEYRSRLTMPKIHIAATGDEFFLVSESHYWYEEMSQPMYLMLCWNAEHILFPHYLRMYEEWASSALTMLQGIEWPKLWWEREYTETGGAITMWTDTTPLRVRAWYSVTLDNGRRDWRLFAGVPAELQPVWWYQDEVQDLGNNTFRYEMQEVPDRWVGFYIEGLWEAVDGRNFHFTTEVHIIPDTFPFPPCEGMECYGEML